MSDKFNRYLQTYAGQHLKYPLSTIGVWEIRGEDPNCDFGGHHYQPILGTVKGKLEDVIRAAVEMPNFWSWGGGGDFRLVEIQSIDDLSKKASLRQEKAELERRIAEINKELS